MAAMPSARESAGCMRGTARPETPNDPESGATAPVMILMSVDLPAPFSPTSAWTSPCRRSNDTPRSARTPENDFVMETARRRELFTAADGTPRGGRDAALVLLFMAGMDGQSKRLSNHVR